MSISIMLNARRRENVGKYRLAYTKPILCGKESKNHILAAHLRLHGGHLVTDRISSFPPGVQNTCCDCAVTILVGRHNFVCYKRKENLRKSAQITYCDSSKRGP